MNLSQGLKYLGALVMLLLVFGSGWFVRDLSANSNIESVLKNHEIELQEIEVVRTRNSTLVKELERAGENRTILLDQIASLRSKPAKIKYITQVETVLVGEPIYITEELPESYLFRTEIGLPVAEFSVEGENDAPEYVFDTADLKIKANLVIAERDSALSIRVESDLESGTEYEVPVDELNVRHIKENKFFEPNILLGGSVSLGAAGAGAGPYVGIAFFHPKQEIDLVHLRLGTTSGRTASGSGSSPRIAVGLDPVLFNVGEPLPVLTNMWIGAGATIDTSGTYSGTLSIGAKL